MRRYEVVFILAPTLTEEEVEQQVASYVTAAEAVGAQVVSVDQWGKRQLAYPIKKHTEGYYVILTIEEPSADAVAELERRFKVSDLVIRFLSIRVDEDLKRARKLEEKREARQRSRLRARMTERVHAASSEKSREPVSADVESFSEETGASELGDEEREESEEATESADAGRE